MGQSAVVSCFHWFPGLPNRFQQQPRQWKDVPPVEYLDNWANWQIPKSVDILFGPAFHLICKWAAAVSHYSSYLIRKEVAEFRIIASNLDLQFPRVHERLENLQGLEWRDLRHGICEGLTMTIDKERTCSSIFITNPWDSTEFHGLMGNVRCFQLHWVHFAAFAWGGPAGSTANDSKR